MVTIGPKIKALRTERHMTQAEFAQRLGVTKSAVSSYENGSRLPSYDILLKIARIFRVSTDALLGNSDNTSITLDVTKLTGQQVLLLSKLIEDLESGNIAQTVISSIPEGVKKVEEIKHQKDV